MRERDREQVRDLLERAGDSPEPQLDHLTAAVPGLLAEAARLRNADDSISDGVRIGLLDQVVPLAWRAIPGLAAAAILLVAISGALFLTENGPTVTGTATTSTIDLDRLFLTGELESAEQDLLLDAWLAAEDDND